MFVSSPPSRSNSRSLRFVPPFCREGDLGCEAFVDKERTLSAGETVPDCVRDSDVGALGWLLAVEGLERGGRIACFLVGKPAVGRGNPAMRMLGFPMNEQRL